MCRIILKSLMESWKTLKRCCDPVFVVRKGFRDLWKSSLCAKVQRSNIREASKSKLEKSHVRVVASWKFDAWRFSGFWEVEFGVFRAFVLFNSAPLLINCAP